MPASVTVAEVNVAFGVGDALGDALVRPGRVVVRLVSGQDCAQLCLAEDQYAVHKLAEDSGTQLRRNDRVVGLPEVRSR